MLSLRYNLFHHRAFKQYIHSLPPPFFQPQEHWPHLFERISQSFNVKTVELYYTIKKQYHQIKYMAYAGGGVLQTLKITNYSNTLKCLFYN